MCLKIQEKPVHSATIFFVDFKSLVWQTFKYSKSFILHRRKINRCCYHYGLISYTVHSYTATISFIAFVLYYRSSSIVPSFTVHPTITVTQDQQKGNQSVVERFTLESNLFFNLNMLRHFEYISLIFRLYEKDYKNIE